MLLLFLVRSAFWQGNVKHTKTELKKSVLLFFELFCVCVRERQSGEVLHIHEGVLTPRAFANELGGGVLTPRALGLTPSAFANEPGRGDFTPSPQCIRERTGGGKKNVPKQKKGCRPEQLQLRNMPYRHFM
jgi:hypothetical protein